MGKSFNIFYNYIKWRRRWRKCWSMEGAEKWRIWRRRIKMEGSSLVEQEIVHQQVHHKEMQEESTGQLQFYCRCRWRWSRCSRNSYKSITSIQQQE
jgi:hypothetical protein